MAAKSKPYEQFGPYVLFKKLEGDALGELFRAARIEGHSLGSFVALRRLSGGNRQALVDSAQTAHQIVPSLTGSSFVKDQRIEVINGIPMVAHDYESGRTLRAIVDKARGTTGAAPNPIPLDQAIVIAERIALSLAATAELRFAGERLVHGALIPQFVWVSDDGEIRVAAQGLGHGIVASLRDEKVATEIARYLSPETHHSGVTSKSTEVYALGAILYLLITGHEPPDATRTSAFTHAVRAAKTMAGAPVPDDLRSIIEKSLNIDASARYASPADMRAALSALTASGRYSATSFNLAFYLSTLLKKEIEAEAAEQEREAKTSVTPYLPVAAPEKAAAAVEVPARARRSRLPIALAATLAVAVVGAAAWFMFAPKKSAAPASIANLASVVPVQPRQVVVPEPIVASPTSTDGAASTIATSTPSGDDAATRKKAFEDAVKKRLQEELLKLQSEHTRQLQQEQSRNAPVLGSSAPVLGSSAPVLGSSAPAQPAPQPIVEERIASVAPLSQQRNEPARIQDDTPSETLQPAPASVVPAPLTPAPAVQPVAPPVTASQPPAVREGDVVDMNDLDQVPKSIRDPRPAYPAIAARQRIEATIMASLLISETGDVLEVKILRGEPRYGFNDAAIRAFRGARYTPGMKDGKRVKTWVAQMIQFKP